jgi:predicted nucleic acid-binding protein
VNKCNVPFSYWLIYRTIFSAKAGITPRRKSADGRVIGNNDLRIAAHAKAAKLILVTNNEREFQRVSGLEIQNWAKSEGAPSSSSQ